MQTVKDEKNVFPLNALNSDVKKYIKSVSDCDKISENITATALLNACGYALSNFYECEVKSGWVERPNLWSIISISSGMGKSVITRRIFKHINKKFIEISDKSKKDLSIYNQWKEKTKRKRELKLEEDVELRNWLCDNGFPTGSVPQKPKKMEMLAHDFTFEKVLQILDENNGRGFLLIDEEVAGLFKQFNRYRPGNDEETFLKLWGYDVISRVRVDEKNSSLIKDPNVSVFGATQKELLFDIYTKARIVNGNIFRFLFCVDHGDDNNNKNPFDALMKVEDVMMPFFYKYLNSYHFEVQQINLPLEDGALDYLSKWREDCFEKYITDMGMDKAIYKSIMGKMDSYIVRIAIVLNRLDSFFTNKDFNEIRIQDLVNAAKIVNFYVIEIQNVLNLTRLNYRKHLTNKEEIKFYEKILPASAPYFDIVKSIEHYLGYSVDQASATLSRWQENGLVKRNAKGMIYKTVL